MKRPLRSTFALLPLAGALVTAGCLDVLGLGDYREGGGGATSGSTSSSTAQSTGTQSASSGTTTSSTGSDTTSSTTTSSSMTTSSSSGTGGAPDCTPPMSQSCYSGTNGTAGIGACRAGTQDCDASGHWGACVGEVDPAMENCQTYLDESCSPDCGEYVAHRTYFSSVEDYLTDLGLALNGDLLLVGNAAANNELSFGGAPLNVVNDYQLVLARLRPDFTHVWSTTYAVATAHSAFVHGDTISIDGYTIGAQTLGGTAFNDFDRIILRINAGTGAVINAAKNPAAPYATSGAPDGYFFEADPSGTNDVLYRRNGVNIDQTTTLWPTSAQTRRITGVLGFTGGAFVYGNFSGTLTAGGMTISTTQTDAFVAKVVGTTVTALVQLHANGSATIQNGVFSSGDLYVVGSFTGTLPDPLSGNNALSSSGTDFYIARLQSAGNGLSLTWAKGFPGAGSATPGPITVDSQGYVTTSVQVGGNSDFGGGMITVTGTTTRILASYRSDGTHAWSRPLTVWPSGIVADAMNNLYVVGGYSQGAADDFSGKNFFGSGVDLTGSQNEDTFAAKLFSAAP